MRLRRGDAIAVLAIVFSAGIGVGVSALLRREPPAVSTYAAARTLWVRNASGPMVPVAVAAHDIPAGATLTDADLRVIYRPLRPNTASSPEQLVGLRVNRPVPRNWVIQPRYLEATVPPMLEAPRSSAAIPRR
jgi:Flp pilus assembly protein CpaB